MTCFGGNNTAGSIDVAAALNANRGCHSPGDFEAGTLICFTGDKETADPISASEGKTYTHEGGSFRMHNVVGAVAVQERAAHPNLNAGPGGKGYQPELAYTLEARHHVQSVAIAGEPQAFDTYNQTMTGDVAQTLCSRGDTPGGNAHLVPAILPPTGYIRRLTPTECERLQGMRPGHTDVPFRGKPAADGPRYKAIGNSMAVNVMHWIGKRIQAAVTASRPA